MTRSFRVILLTLAMAASLMVPASASSDAVAEEGSDNIRHVENITFPDSRSGGSRATDSDFLEFTPDADWQPPTAEEVPDFLEVPADYDYPAPGETRTFNLMGTYSRGMYITDITDPENAVLVSHWDCGVLQADVFVFSQTDEAGNVRQYAAYTLDATASVAGDSECAQTLERQLEEQGIILAQSKGTFIADVTDPYRPRTVSFLPMAKGTHQTTVHPSGDYIYNSAAVVRADRNRIGSIEVYDVSDPANPELVNELMLQTGLDSHDMTFTPEGDRLYVAALTHSFVINTEDPASPQIVSRIFDPAINIHHDAHRITVDGTLGERDFMLIGDELAGAISAGYCPGGGIHVYDITGPLENAPVKVGAFFIPEVRATPADPGGVQTCTAHVIQPIPGTTLLSVAWYNAGVRILDYSGLGTLNGAGAQVGAANTSVTPGIQQVGYYRFDDSNLWSAKVHELDDDGFYVFGGDTRRTLDIWRVDLDVSSYSAGGDEDRGTWMSPNAAMRRALTVPRESTLRGGYTPFCLLPGTAA